MNPRSRQSFLTGAPCALVILFLSTCLPVYGQADSGPPVRVRTPGTAFMPEGSGVTVDDVSGGRRFRGRPGAKVVVRGQLQLPPAQTGEPKMQGLVVHFRTSPNGPTLRAVELRNGSKTEFRIETHLGGDYGVRETASPGGGANAWAWRDPIPVGSSSVVRLEIIFPIGFDSPIDPGELVLLDVAADFPRKPRTFSESAARIPRETISPRPIVAAAVAIPTQAGPTEAGLVYAIGADHDLLWYHHTGREDGTLRWTAPTGKVVGTGWAFRQVFSGGDGVIYAITPEGDLLWYRHDGRGDGSPHWTAPEARKVGIGWIFEHVFYGGDGVIYAITSDGDLLWYRHDGRADGSMTWANRGQRKEVGEAWHFEHVFSGGEGVIYAVTADGDLLWYRHDGRADGSMTWANGGQRRKVGEAWNFEHVFSSGDGVIYGVTDSGDLLWYRHDGRGDGTFRWAAPSGANVGTGWFFEIVFSGANLGG